MTWEQALAELYLLEADSDPITSDWAYDELAGLGADNG